MKKNAGKLVKATCYNKHVTKWTGKRVTVLGLGRSGFSAACYLAKLGASVFVSEFSPKADQSLVDGLSHLGIDYELGEHSARAKATDLVVISPGIKPDTPIVKELEAQGLELISDLELAYRESRIPFIMVTGTNGKSTTTALINHILIDSGLKSSDCGNIGKPILDQIHNKLDFLVVEASSYQLYYTTSFCPKIAVWLNLTPDHIDWHKTIEAYGQAKLLPFQRQKSSDFAILNFDDSFVAQIKASGQVVPFSTNKDLSQFTQSAFLKNDSLIYKGNDKIESICRPEEMKILGLHNVENALASIAACRLAGVSAPAIAKALKEFRALEHRLEYVATIDGIAFYNDSKATNPDSTIKALSSFPGQKIVLIAGGKDKGTDLKEMVEAIQDSVNSVILIGEAKDRFKQALEINGFTNIHLANDIKEAVDLGAKLKQGPVVLSPACASFDMFKNYEERGSVFKDIVHSKLEKLTPSI